MVEEMEPSLAAKTIPKSSWHGLWLFRCCSFLIGEHQYYIHSKATAEEKQTDFRRYTPNFHLPDRSPHDIPTEKNTTSHPQAV
jgi:hypothetical protein